MSGDGDLCYITASEAIACFKAKSLSPVEVMKAVIARSDVVNPKLNALTATSYDRALEQARTAEATYSKGDVPIRPLEGIPIAIKDCHPVKDEITTFGSLIFANDRSAKSTPTVDRLLNAGAIMHCRTTTPEFAIGIITHSRLWGVTRNPWNLDYSPCGSSGGSGAALASGMTVLADGSDSGGSIRAPASACGVVGYLPPYGRNPSDSGLAYEGLLRYGPMARSVADAALMQNVMSGPHPEDPSSFHDKIVLPVSYPPAKGLRIALSMDLGFYQIDPEVDVVLRNAAYVLRDLGCQVTEIALPWTVSVADAMNRYVEFLIHSAYAPLMDKHEDLLSEHIKSLIGKGAQLHASELASFFSMRGVLYEGIKPVFEDFDLLICPTLSVPGVAADHNSMDQNFTVDGKPNGAYLEWGLTYPFNMLYYLPVMSVPCGVAANKLPIGMQIVGRPFDDQTVFRLATAFESAQPWANRHPQI
jgi:Asp-tRNA(Asn)/Glu-tRNA(Gln) amidotransferase A subunit family amidase